MGVCGCGKSTVGALLAQRTGGTYLDGDHFHPPENKRKMGSGVPLDDGDREGWLTAIRDAVDTHSGSWPLFFGCSALKRKYRDLLRSGELGGRVQFIHLVGRRELLEERMLAREGHYMKVGMLESQFADLEPLGEGEVGFDVDVSERPAEIADRVLAQITAE